jgi:tetratricopeptide (TPR) repeat protein
LKKMSQRIRKTQVSLLAGIIILAGCAAPVSLKSGGDGFVASYQEYQGYIKAGQAALNQKEYWEAIEYYSRAITLSPFEAGHYYGRGVARYRNGQIEMAVEDFDKVILLEARFRSAFIYRGLCRLERGEYRKALEDYKTALAYDPKDHVINNNLAWFYAEVRDESLRDTTLALEYARKAVELSHEANAETLDTLAEVYFLNGAFEEALEAEKKALRLEPDNELFKKNLSRYEEVLGKEE